MRWIDRGQEPDGVAEYARRYTEGWVDYFQERIGERPTDFLWSVFRPELGSRSNGICWYCERQCEAAGDLAPTVDHFRPISLFPQLSYAWSNWIFSCRRCNVDNKRNRWPESGYVDPCAYDVAERPERYFDYDAYTGEIIPNGSLSGIALERAFHSIADLGLNKLDVMFYRLQWTRQFATDLLSLPLSERRALAEYITQQPVEYAGVTGMMMERLRLDGSI